MSQACVNSAGFGPHNPVMARLAENRRLTAAGHFQDVRHLNFFLEQSGLQHDPGDALAIVPRQPDAAVDAFLRRIGVPADAHVQIALAEPPANGAAPPAFQVPAFLEQCQYPVNTVSLAGSLTVPTRSALT